MNETRRLIQTYREAKNRAVYEPVGAIESFLVPCCRCIDLGQLPIYECAGNSRHRAGVVYYCKHNNFLNVNETIIPEETIKAGKTWTNCPYRK
jgi:hypothetical protein